MNKILSIFFCMFISLSVYSVEPAASNATPANLESMRSDFERERAAVVDEYAGRIKTLDAAYLDRLQKLQKDLSTTGDKAGAMAAGYEMDRLAGEKKILDDASFTTLMVLQNIQSSFRKQISQLKSQQMRLAKTATLSQAESANTDKKEQNKPAIGLEAAKINMPPQSATTNQVAVLAIPTGNEKKQHLAIGCKVTVSTTHLGEPGEGAGDVLVDGDLYTRWSSDYREPQEIILDLGKVVKIVEMRLHWERASATRYCVYISQDGKSWSSAYLYMQTQPGDPAERVDDIRLAQGECRYIKLDLQNCINKEWGFSLYEIEVQGAK